MVGPAGGTQSIAGEPGLTSTCGTGTPGSSKAGTPESRRVGLDPGDSSGQGAHLRPFLLREALVPLALLPRGVLQAPWVNPQPPKVSSQPRAPVPRASLSRCWLGVRDISWTREGSRSP